MHPRAFLAMVCAAVLLTVVAPGHAQGPAKVYRIGVLDTSPITPNPNLDAFRQALRELGYVEGRNVVFEFRSGADRAGAFPSLAAELVRLKVDLILTRGTAAVTAAKNATTTIPIVMAASGDPLGTGVVSSLARPGGNVTGLSALTAEVSGKRVQLLRDAIPGVRRLAVILDRGTGLADQQWQTTAETARALGIEPQLIEIARAEDLEPAFDLAVKRRADAVVVGLGSIMQGNVARIAALVTRRRLPAAFISREFVDAGGLLAYGVSYPDSYRRAARYVDRIFKGAKPADLPIEQPTKFEFVINLRTAQTFGLTIPESVLLRADEVIR